MDLRRVSAGTGGILPACILSASMALPHAHAAESTRPAAAERELVLSVQRRVTDAERREHVAQETLRVPLDRVAFVTQHLWNNGEPDGPPQPPHLFIGSGSAENCRRTREINARYILPALQAARAAGLMVAHSQPAFIAKRYAQHQAIAAEVASRPAETPWPPAVIPKFSSEQMAAWTVKDWPGWGLMDFPTALKPLSSEPVTVASEELNHVLQKRGITTLVYVGYATDMCLIGYTGGLNDMVKKFGYRAVVLREATLATELADGRSGLDKTRESLEKIEREYAPTASIADFLAAVASAGAPAEVDRKVFLTPAASNLYYLIDRERYTWYLKPNVVQDVADVWAYETNSYGLRDVEFPLAKPPGSLRIVCLGDSVTYGAGVSFDQTYGQQLERMLKVHKWDTKVINAGIGSHRAWHGLERLEKDVIRFEPDVVTVCFGFNDGVLQPQTLWEEWRKALAAQSPGQEPTHSISTRLVPLEGGLTPSVPIDEYAGHLAAIVKKLRERTRARIYFVEPAVITERYHPDWPPEVRNRQKTVYNAYREKMKQVGAELNVSIVDVYDRFAPQPEKLIFADGIHPNCQGLRIYAEELYKRIRADLDL